MGLQTMNRMKMSLLTEANINIINNDNNEQIRYRIDSLSEKDDDAKSYDPNSTDKSSYFSSSDNNTSSNQRYQTMNSSDNNTTAISYRSTDDEESQMSVLANFGYVKDKDFSITLKGKVFIANNQNKYDRPVAIKKMLKDKNLQIV